MYAVSFRHLVFCILPRGLVRELYVVLHLLLTGRDTNYKKTIQFVDMCSTTVLYVQCTQYGQSDERQRDTSDQRDRVHEHPPSTSQTMVIRFVRPSRTSHSIDRTAVYTADSVDHRHTAQPQRHCACIVHTVNTAYCLLGVSLYRYLVHAYSIPSWCDVKVGLSINGDR